MTQIKPKPDRKPGAKPQRFTDMLDPQNAMATVSNDTVVAAGDDVSKPEVTERKSGKSKQMDGQPIRIGKTLWLRLKSLQLELAEKDQNKTLQDLANEALDAYLSARGK